MTTERQQPTQELDEPADGLDQFEITDNTSDEQRALEAQALSELDGDDEPGEVPQAEQESEAPPEAQPVSQTPPEPEAEPTPEPEPTPQPRLEDSPQWKKAQASWQKQIDAERNQRLEAQKKLDAFNLETEVEARLRRQEAKLEPTYGADDAKRIARDPDYVAQVRAAVEGENAVKQAQETQKQSLVYTRQNILHGYVDNVVKGYGLDAEDGEALLSLITPAALNDGDAATQVGIAIQNMSARLAKQRNSQAAAQKAVRDRVPAETPATRPETGRSPGDAPESNERKLARIRQKPSWEWTEDDLKFMRS